MTKLTTIESLILRAVVINSGDWLNCDGAYVGEVLALQALGYVQSRVLNGQLQVRSARNDD